MAEKDPKRGDCSRDFPKTHRAWPENSPSVAPLQPPPCLRSAHIQGRGRARRKWRAGGAVQFLNKLVKLELQDANSITSQNYAMVSTLTPLVDSKPTFKVCKYSFELS